jgi:NADPH2:quinone reductase
VQYPINYRTQDFTEEVRKAVGKEGLDVVFDSLGGKVFKQSKKLLGASGRAVGYGAADRSSSKLPGILADISLLFGFGFYNPAFLLMQSQSIIGVNMLRVADHRPMVLKRCMDEVVALAEKGELKPIVGGVFPHTQLAAAHEFLESRKSNGKVVVTW